MAEIKIEKKKPVWPWILLGLLILAAILYFVFANNDNSTEDNDNTEQEQDTTYTSQADSNTTRWEDNTAANTTDNEVSTFITHVSDQSRMGVDHEYTNNALLHLINAVETKARQVNVDIDNDLQKIRENARQITQNPQGTNHANKIKEVGTDLAGTLENIQQEKFPNLSQEVNEVRTAAQNIDTSVLTLEQKDKINLFFNKAADVLKKMS